MYPSESHLPEKSARFRFVFEANKRWKNKHCPQWRFVWSVHI